jgi:hypothetical protein
LRGSAIGAEIETEIEIEWVCREAANPLDLDLNPRAAGPIPLNLDLDLDLSHYCLHSHFTRLQQLHNRKSLDATSLNRYIAKPLKSQDK